MTRVRRYRSVLPKLRALGVRDWVRLGRAQLAVLRAQLDVWLRPQGELVSGANGVAPTSAGATRRDDAERVGIAVRRVANHGLFSPTCLVRALAICRLLRLERIPGGRIRVGVAMRDGKFVAHAWVEYGGVVIGDDDAVVSRYDAIDDLKVVAGD